MERYVVPTPDGEHVLWVVGKRILVCNHDLRSEIALLLLGGDPCPCVCYALVAEWLSCPYDSDLPFLARAGSETYMRVRRSAHNAASLNRSWFFNDVYGKELRLEGI